MEIINEILKWPIIVQGALGSFLFWLVFTVGQKSFTLVNKKIKDENELGSFFGKTASDEFFKGNHEMSNYSFFICIYGAFHYFLKFILAVFIGFIFSNLIPAFSYVGYIIAFWFWFKALTYVTHFSKFRKEEKVKNVK